MDDDSTEQEVSISVEKVLDKSNKRNLNFKESPQNKKIKNQKELFYFLKENNGFFFI